MIKGFDDTIYGLAYRNGRYQEGKWNIHFYDTETQRNSGMQHCKALSPPSENITFEFSLRDIKCLQELL